MYHLMGKLFALVLNIGYQKGLITQRNCYILNDDDGIMVIVMTTMTMMLIIAMMIIVTMTAV